MKAGIYGTMQSLAQEIDRRQTDRKDYVVQSNAIRVSSDSTGTDLIAGVSGLGSAGGRMTELALHQMALHHGVPKKYIERMATDQPDLLDHNINTWLERDDRKRMVRMRDGLVDAYLSSSYKRMDHMPVMSMILPTLLKSKVDVKSCDVTDTRMFIKVVSKRLQGDVKVGDPVQMGVMIRNSEVGMGALDVTPLIYRLVCDNGMVSARSLGGGIRHTHRGVAQDLGVIFSQATLEAEQVAISGQIRDTVEQLLSPETFEKHLSAMQATATREIKGSAPEAIKVLGKMVNYTESEGDEILKHLIRGGDTTQWGMLNAVTSFAQTVDSYDRSTELEAIGGKVLELSPKMWTAVSEAA